MDLGACLDRLKFDSRMYEINLQQGAIKPEELKKYLESLPDLSDQVVAVKLDSEGVPQDQSANGADANAHGFHQ